MPFQTYQSEDLDWPLASGAQQGIDPTLLPQGLVRRVENLRWVKDFRLQKRNGFDAVTTTEINASNPGNLRRLATRDDGLVMLDDVGLYAYSTGLDRTVLVDRVSSLGIDGRRGVAARHPTHLYDADVAHANGYTLYTWYDQTNDDVYARVEHEASGTVLINDTKLNGATTAKAPRAVAAGNVLIAVWWEGGDILARTVDATDTTPSWAAESTLYSDGHASTPELQVNPYGSDWLLIYNRSGDFAVKMISGALVELDNTTAGGDADQKCDVIGTAGEEIYIATFSSNISSGVRVYAVDSNLTLIGSVVVDAATAPVVNKLALCRLTSTSALLAWSPAVAATAQWTKRVAITNLGAVSGSVMTTHRSSLVSYPFVEAGRGYVWAAHFIPTTGVQNSYFLLDLKTDQLSTAQRAAVVGRVAFGEGEAPNSCAPSHVPATVTGRRRWVATVKAASYLGAQVDTWQIDTSAAQHGHVVELGEALAVGGCGVRSYDRAGAAELGFYLYAESLTLTPGSGGSMAAGDYGYTVMPEWLDADGVLHRGQPAPAKTATVSASGKCTVQWQPSSLTDKTDESLTNRPIVWVVYRTTVDGTIYYRRTVLANTPDSATALSFEDTASDAAAALTTGEILYTTGGRLANQHPPPSRIVVEHRNRIVGVDDEDQTRVWYSFERAAGLGLATHLDLHFRVDDGGPITALWSLDDALCVAKADRIYAVYGDGKNPNGVGGYSSPRLIVTDSGCVDFRSVLRLPAGVAYASRDRKANGTTRLMMMPRGAGSPLNIGDPVQDELESFPFVTAAVLVPDEEQARWTVVDDADTPTAGRILVYDYSLDRWSVYNVQAKPFASAVLWDGTYTTTEAGATAVYKQATDWDDFGHYINAEIETGDIRAAGILGYQKARAARCLATYRAACKLTIETTRRRHGRAAAVTDSKSWHVDSLTAGDEVVREYYPPDGFVESIRIKLKDERHPKVATNTESVWWHTVGINVARDTTAPRTVAAQR